MPFGARHDDVPTLGLHAASSEARRARRWAAATMTGLVPDDHLDNVGLAVSELVTNALAAAARHADWSLQDTPVRLSLLTTQRWTRVEVRDPEPHLQPPGPHGLMDESGRGLVIIEALGHWGYCLGPGCKITYAVLPIDGDLTAAELAAARPPKGRWIETYANDLRIGDLVRVPGEPERRLISRSYPFVTSVKFRVTFDGGVEEYWFKSSRVEIWDESGAVSERVIDISAKAIR